MLRRVARLVCAFATFAYGLWGGLAYAGNPSFTAPEKTSYDGMGVDLLTSHFAKSQVFLTIGDPDHGGLAWAYMGHAYTDSYSGAVEHWGGGITRSLDKMDVKMAASTDSYYGTCLSTCTNTQGGPATLVLSGSNWIYRRADGAVYTFDAQATPNNTTDYGTVRFIGKLLSILRPDGSLVTINYELQSGCTDPGQCYRIKSVVSNSGYALKYLYSATDFQTMTGVQAINLLVHSCDATITTCTGYESAIAISQSGGTLTVTDAAGGAFAFTVGPLNNEDPDDPTYVDAVTAYQDALGAQTSTTYDGYGRIKTYADPRGTWTYSYSDTTLKQVQAVGDRTITLTDPSSTTIMTTKVSKSPRYMDTVADGLGRTTAYGNSQYAVPGYTGKYYYLLTSVAKPESNTTGYTYDSRQNITQVTNTPKTGSGLSATNLTAGYDTTCSNTKTCKQPNWTKDAKGNQTDYTYDTTHGGVLTVTLPADQNGLRQRTYNTYTSFDTGNGTVYRLTRSDTCGLSSTQLALTACPSTTTIAVTTVDYGNATTAPKTYKSFQPYATTQTDGPGSVSATTTYTYDNVGNVVAVDGPRSDVTDITYKTYDADRRVIFDIGVLPGGTGNPHRSVVKHTYDGDGHETKTEFGYAGTDHTDGSDFVVTSFKRMTYDIVGRLIKSEEVLP